MRDSVEDNPAIRFNPDKGLPLPKEVTECIMQALELNGYVLIRQDFSLMEFNRVSFDQTQTVIFDLGKVIAMRNSRTIATVQTDNDVKALDVLMHLAASNFALIPQFKQISHVATIPVSDCPYADYTMHGGNAGIFHISKRKMTHHDS